MRDAEDILDQTGLRPYRDHLAGELDFGRQKLLDTEGRIQRFTRKYGAHTVAARKARETKPADAKA